MNHEYWIDADGYLVCGIREKNEWESVAEIPQEHVESLSRLLAAAPDLLAACKIALPFIIAHDVTCGTISGAALQIQDAITKATQ